MGIATRIHAFQSHDQNVGGIGVGDEIARVALVAGQQVPDEFQYRVLVFRPVNLAGVALIDEEAHHDGLFFGMAEKVDALRTAFGVTAGAAPDRFLIALAVLSLLSAVAEEEPLICVVDDEQWLDTASVQALAFVARRLEAESVGLIFAARAPSGELSGLPELVVGGLPDEDAHALLTSVLTAPLDPRVCDQIVTETRGNPLALVELPRGVKSADLAGGFALPGVMPCRASSRE